MFVQASGNTAGLTTESPKDQAGEGTAPMGVPTAVCPNWGQPTGLPGSSGGRA